jgi:uncharacterized protein (DUF58 family)
MVIQRYIYSKYWNRNLDVKISYKNYDCIAGEENELKEVIVNNKALPLPMLHVKFDTSKSFVFENESNSNISDNYYRDDVFTVMGHQSVTRTLKFRCTKRGCYYMHDTNITSSDLFLHLTLTDRRENHAVIHVFPEKVNLDFFEIPFKTITGNFATQRTLVEDPFEFKGIREYQPYDGMKKINYKSSAKHNSLQVNTFFMTSSQEVHILLNLDSQTYSRDDRMTEAIISLASSIAEKFIGSGIPVALTTNGIDTFTNEQILREAGGGTNHMLSIDTALARIDNHADNIKFHNVLSNCFSDINEQTYYIIISNERNDEIISTYENAKQNGASSYYIVPELKHYPVNETMNINDMIKWDIEY